METRSTYEKWLDNIGDREAHRNLNERGRHRSMTRFRGLPVASRVSRLVAAIIDKLLIVGTAVPGAICLMVADVNLTGSQLRPTNLVVAVVALALLALLPLPLTIYQIVLISLDGQTIGKRLAGLRMVKTDEEWVPGFVDGWLLRAFLFDLAVAVPWIVYLFVPGADSWIVLPILGTVFFVLDTVLIFGSNSRCLHDWVAGTKVIQSATWVD
jgi:uncharacterized RDD family membrane protein YckC